MLRPVDERDRDFVPVSCRVGSGIPDVSLVPVHIELGSYVLDDRAGDVAEMTTGLAQQGDAVLVRGHAFRLAAVPGWPSELSAVARVCLIRHSVVIDECVVHRLANGRARIRSAADFVRTFTKT